MLFEALESRVLLSTIVWGGGGDATSWSNAANWVDRANLVDVVLPANGGEAEIGVEFAEGAGPYDTSVQQAGLASAVTLNLADGAFTSAGVLEFSGAVQAAALEPDITFQGKEKGQVIEPDGTKVELSLSGAGSVEVWLAATGFIERVELTDTDLKSKLTVKTDKGGDGQADVIDLIANGSLVLR